MTQYHFKNLIFEGGGVKEEKNNGEERSPLTRDDRDKTAHKLARRQVYS
jgi:hypothetical protein